MFASFTAIGIPAFVKKPIPFLLPRIVDLLPKGTKPMMKGKIFSIAQSTGFSDWV